MPTPETWQDLEHLDPAKLNARIRDENARLAKPAFGFLNTAPTVSLAGGTVHDMRFTKSLLNRTTTTSGSGYFNGLQVSESGLYHIDSSVSAVVTGTTTNLYFITYILVNGATVSRGIYTARTGYIQTAIAGKLHAMTAGDTVTLQIYTSGTSIDLGHNGDTARTCFLSANRIGDNPWATWA